MSRTLILGYGNPDREDDGVAWHILAAISLKLGRPTPTSPLDGFEIEGMDPDLQFALQLVPEMAETLAEYDRVCLIDAHTGAVPEEVHIERIQSQFQASPFTHHLTPHTLASFTEKLYHRTPEIVLVSVRGYQFGFAHELSPQTSHLANQAVEIIWNWLNTDVLP